MPSLTSCYFCGDAVGASLDEYDLPADASPDDQVTVTLCAGCKGKLTELLDEIDPAGGDAGAATDPTTATDVAGGSSAESDADPAIETDPGLDPVAGDQEPIFADDGDAVLDEELPTGASVEERPFASDEDDESADESGDESGDASVADAADPHEQASNPAEPAPGDVVLEADGTIAAPSAGEAEADPDASDADADGAPDSSGATGGEDDSDAGTATPPDEANAGGSGSTSSTPSGAPTSAASGAGERSADGPLADVSPRTYNRVVRLLQNREFPVDRADFEALATSAYELDHGECEAALDGAIEKGLLEEREGMLYRPE